MASAESFEQLFKEIYDDNLTIKQDHEKLKSQLLNVLAENKRLDKELHDVLKQKFQSPLATENEIVSNLQKQINIAQSEKEYVTKLWQNSVKTTDYLEEELKVYQAGSEQFVPKKEVQKMKTFYEETIRSLELNLSSTQEKLNETVKQVTSELNLKHATIDQSLENQTGALKIIKNLESEIFKLQERLKETTKSNDSLGKVIHNKEEIIQGLKRKNSEYRAQVTEAVNVVEAALNEKDAALFREQEIQELNQKLIQRVADITKEHEEKTKNEVAIVKEEYSNKIKNMLDDFNQTQVEMKNKTLEIENYAKKCLILENEIQKLQGRTIGSEDTNISKLLVLEKNLESTFQKLLLSEKQNIQLISEKDSIKNDLEQMAGLYERNLKSKEIEIATLKNRISQLDCELNNKHSDLSSLTEKVEKLNMKIELTEKEMLEQRKHYEIATKQQHLEKLEEITLNHNKTITDLQSQIQIKDQINKKWITETKTITESLEKLVSNLKLEIQTLKKDNKNLKEKLKRSENKIYQYKSFLELISNDVNKISVLAVGNQGIS